MQQLKDDGIIILRNFFSKEDILNLLEASKEVFKIQFKHFGYKNYETDNGFKESMIRLFNEHRDVFQNCGKLIQSGLIQLYKIAYDDKLISKLKELGLTNPLVCTRPVLFFNHPKLAEKEHYYKTPRHQDYPSMLSSSDSLVVWIPLINVDESNGAVVFYAKSHKLGKIEPSKTDTGFAEVIIDDSYQKIQPSMNVGDIAIFSTFLVHESGNIINDSIRWSCHFRYTNLDDEDFINRGYPSPYIYKSTAI